MKVLLLAASLALSLPTIALADDEKAATLLPGALDLPIVDGANVPDDCLFPASLVNARYQLACVVMPRDTRGGEISATYFGLLGQRGWRQGDMIVGGFSAVLRSDDGCEQVLGIYPSTFPPNTEDADNAVIWFALDRERACAAPTASPAP